MNKVSKKFLFLSVFLFAIFAVYTVLIKTIDVGIAENTAEIGFSSVNFAVADVFTFNEFWYTLSEYLGYISLGVCVAFALVGLFQLIKVKSIKSVNKDIWVLAGFYVVVIGFYALFEVLEVNYRPVILDEGLEASYPSSHTVLAVCVLASAVIEFEKYFLQKKVLKNVLQASCIVLAALTVVARMLSGVHWITDIVGGLLLSAALVSGFAAAYKTVEK